MSNEIQTGLIKFPQISNAQCSLKSYHTYSNNLPLFHVQNTYRTFLHTLTLTETLVLSLYELKRKCSVSFNVSLKYKRLRSALTQLHSKSIQRETKEIASTAILHIKSV